ncbi:MAG: transposase, partial [Eubacterium sp.]|nr:transposase [Eubacterium sp.]
MKVISSYKVEILKLHKPLKQTMEICRFAVSWLLPVIDAEWNSLSLIGQEKLRFNAAEKLIHGTKKNMAKYPFDAAFPKMPSYLRRAVLQHVMGLISSTLTQKRKLQLSGKRAEGTSRRDAVHYMPVFYRDNMYRKKEDGVYLKLYNGKDWIWQKVLLKKTDLDYIRRHWRGVKEKSPVLVKRYKKYYLQFAFEENVKLGNTPVEKSRICAVDLGINTDAVCSIMTADGTVAARKFISFPAEKDRLYHVLNRVRKKQREHGSKSVTGFWAYAKRLNDQI